jgi:hypothetical protein
MDSAERHETLRRIVEKTSTEQRVPADSFVAATMRKVRAGRRRKEVMRIGLRAAALAMRVRSR